MAAIPGATPRKDKTPFLASLRAALIRQLVTFRSGATRLVRSTRQLAPERFPLTSSALVTRPSAAARLLSTSSVPSTQPSEVAHLEATPPALPTRLWAFLPAAASRQPITLSASAPVSRV